MNDIDVKMNDAGMEELRERGRVYLANIAENVRVESQSICPVKTGALRASIEVFDGEDEDTKYIGSKTIDYAVAVELGHVTSKGNTVPPDPYLRDALDNVMSSISSLFRG